MGWVGLLFAADLESSLRIATGFVLALGGAAGVYATVAGVRATRTNRSLEERKQEWAEIRDTNASLVERADACEARERVLRTEMDALNARDTERETELRALRRQVERMAGDHGWGSEKA